MGKRIRQTVTIIITETWTITWTDGEQSSVIYRFRRQNDVHPDAPAPTEQQPLLEDEEVQDSELPDAPE